MKFIVTIFIFVLFAITQTPLGQLLKLPVLIEHFNKHRNQDGISFFEFLNYHYSTDHNDADESEDQELPFKTMDLQNFGFAIVPAILKQEFSLSFEVTAKVMLNDAYTPQQHLCSIFHPPRV